MVERERQCSVCTLGEWITPLGAAQPNAGIYDTLLEGWADEGLEGGAPHAGAGNTSRWVARCSEER